LAVATVLVVVAMAAGAIASFLVGMVVIDFGVLDWVAVARVDTECLAVASTVADCYSVDTA